MMRESKESVYSKIFILGGWGIFFGFEFFTGGIWFLLVDDDIDCNSVDVVDPLHFPLPLSLAPDLVG